MSTSEGGAALPVALPDLVYPIRPGVENEELRWSLRSVAVNAAGLFDKIWVVGTTIPGWLRNTQMIEASAPGGKGADTRAKLAAAATHPDVADRFVMMSDDYFLVDSITEWQSFHMGPTSAFVKRLSALDPPVTLGNSKWLRTVVSTAEWMAERGYPDILVRQGHRPLLWDKAKLAATIAAYPSDRLVDVTGLYDAAGAAGVGRRGGNAKVRADSVEFHQRLAELDIPWLSSNDRSFNEGMIGGYIRGMFRAPSIYEEA